MIYFWRWLTNSHHDDSSARHRIVLGITSFILSYGSGEYSVWSPAFAQTQIPDNTLGAERSIVVPNGIIPGINRVDGGAVRNSNLFHSFQQFDIPAGGGAYFNPPNAQITNVIVRVTGSLASQIQGTLGVVGDANLFLVNSNGIVFGPQAQIDVRGSFLASTAPQIRFADNTILDNSPTTPPLLTVAAPLGLNFPSQNFPNQATAAPIIVNGANFYVPSQRTFALVGGPVQIMGSTAPNYTGILAGGAPFITLADGTVIPTTGGGRIELTGITTGGVDLIANSNGWTIAPVANSQMADVSLTQNATIDIFSQGGGGIAIHSNNFRLAENSRIALFNLGNTATNGLSISAQNTIELNGTGNYLSTFDKFGNFTSGPSEFRNGLFTISFGTGNAGNIALAGRNLLMNNGAFAIASSALSAPGGSVLLNIADSISIDNSAAVTATRGGSSGTAGDIIVNTRNLLLRNQGELLAGTAGSGNGGALTVNAAESVQIDGVEPFLRVGFLVNTGLNTGTVANARGGDLTVNTPLLRLNNGGRISASTAGSNFAGLIRLNVNRLEMVGLIPSGMAGSRIDAESYGAFGAGAASDIEINADRVIVADLGTISVSSFGIGNAGNLNLRANRLELLRGGSIQGTVAAAQEGNLNLITETMILRNGKLITDAQGVSTGSNINITTGTLTLIENSHITANAKAGKGGNIFINAQGIFRSDNDIISASSQLGIDGIVQIQTPSVNVNNSLVPLSAKFIDSTTRLSSNCLSQTNLSETATNRSNFQITGNGGIARSPLDEKFFSYYGTVNVIPTENRTNMITRQPNYLNSSFYSQNSGWQEANTLSRSDDGKLWLNTKPQESLAGVEELVCQYATKPAK
ncbi:MAG: filamentous hemagglutinin N-terminal domain-containing protein [Pseudanabaena sp. ELA607]